MSRASHLKNTYGITEEDYAFILQKQDGRCAVCRRPQSEFRTRLCVDHEHIPGGGGAVRGILCQWCNRFVVGRHRGPAGVAVLRAASDYLKGPYTGFFAPPKRKKKRAKRKTSGLNTRRKRTK